MCRRAVLRTLPALLFLAALTGGCSPASSLYAESGWVRAPLPGKNVGSGYFSVVNETDEDRLLVGARSPDAERVEIHTHLSDGAMMRMRRLEELKVPARSRVAFSPGGHHLMLFGMNGAADPVTVTLEFADGSELTAGFELRHLPSRADTRLHLLAGAPASE